MRTTLLSKGVCDMNSAEVSIKLERLQLERAGRGLFPEPLSTHFATGVLNILTGPNGSGKTTLLDIIALRTKPPDGRIVHRAGHVHATDIAYLPQQLWDVLDIRIADLLVLAVGPNCSCPTGVPEPLIEALARPKKDLGALSGGQRQILLFWLVSSQSKRIYVYDEPLRHLDDIANRYVVSRIEDQVKRGMLVVLSEHSAEKHWSVACDRVALTTEAAAA